MISLLGSIGWGLLAVGAITHIWHHRRLRSLLAMHFDHERFPAIVLTGIEATLAVALPLALLTDSSVLPWLALVALGLSIVFMVWITRLLLTGSSLPCACSFSDGPTSWWSLMRACCAGLVGLLAFAAVGDQAADDQALTIVTLAVGWAIAAAIFVVPEAITWPAASKALMARVDAYNLDASGSGVD